MSYLDNQKVRQISFYILLIALGIFLFKEFLSFLPAFLGALTFYILMRNANNYLVRKKKWKKSLAAAMLISISILVVLIPVWLFINLLSGKIHTVIQNSAAIEMALAKTVTSIEQSLQIEILNQKNIQQISIKLAALLPNLLGATFSSLTSLMIMYFLLYFMLTGSRNMEAWLYENIPLKDENVALIGKELDTLVISNTLGIPLTALLQGLVALIGYWAIGVPDIGFWFVITCISAMLPFVGAALAYVPLSLLLFAEGSSTKCIILLIYGFGIVGSVDNIFRFALQKKLGDVHPLITVFGVIIGLNLFGFIGLIFGPILLSLFILLIKIYLNEFGKKA